MAQRYAGLRCVSRRKIEWLPFIPASFISFQVSLESVRCIKDTEKWNDFQVLKNVSKAIKSL